MDTVVTKKDDFKNPTIVTKILKPFSYRKSSDRPSVDQFSNKGYLGSNVKILDSKRNFVTLQLVQVHRHRNPKNVIIGHSKIYSLRNKFVGVDELIKIKPMSV